MHPASISAELLTFPISQITKTIATARQSTTAPFGSSLASEANLGESVAINGAALNTPGRGAANRSLLDGAILGVCNILVFFQSYKYNTILSCPKVPKDLNALKMVEEEPVTSGTYLSQFKLTA